jgi:hypothetical protein
VLKDLEKARACMKDKVENLNESEDNENNNSLPIEEMKYIEWKSDSSDEEGFRVVSRQRSKKRGRKLKFQKNGRSKVVESLPIEETSPFEGGKIEVTLFTTSGRELLGKQNSLKW